MVVDGDRGYYCTGGCVDYCDATRGARVGYVDQIAIRAPPRPGEFVYLLDYEGHGCVGTVEGVEGWYVCVRPDWATWMGGPRPVEP